MRVFGKTPTYPVIYVNSSQIRPMAYRIWRFGTRASSKSIEEAQRTTHTPVSAADFHGADAKNAAEWTGRPVAICQLRKSSRLNFRRLELLLRCHPLICCLQNLSNSDTPEKTGPVPFSAHLPRPQLFMVSSINISKVHCRQR